MESMYSSQETINVLINGLILNRLWKYRSMSLEVMIMNGESSWNKEWKWMDWILRIYGIILLFYKPEQFMIIQKYKQVIDYTMRMETKWIRSIISSILDGVRSMMNGLVSTLLEYRNQIHKLRLKKQEYIRCNPMKK